MKRTLIALFFVATIAGTSFSARAEEYKPDDVVIFDIAAENWVTTEAARVVLNIEAAVTDKSSGAMRDTMGKAVDAVAKAEWRLTSFNRQQDQTGMERWSAQYEARLPERSLNGLTDAAKKASKAGMQITIADIDFSPTLAETQKAISLTRTSLYAKANEQLADLNKAMQGRTYRIATIDFTGSTAQPEYAQARAPRMVMSMAKSVNSDTMGSMEKSEKIILTARVILAAEPTKSK